MPESVFICTKQECVYVDTRTMRSDVVTVEDQIFVMQKTPQVFVFSSTPASGD